MMDYEEPKMCQACINNGNDYCFACNNGNQFKPQTNYDHIVSKTPEELAEWMLKFGNPYYLICPPIHNAIGDCPTSPCEICWLDWLKSPVEVDT